MGLFNKRDGIAEEVSIDAELATALETNVALTAKIAELETALSLVATKNKISAKADMLGVAVENMDAFLKEHTDFESQVDALFALKAESTEVNTKEFLESAPESAGEGTSADTRIADGEDEFVPSSQKEALSYLKENMPELTAKDRSLEARNLYPKLWEK